MTYVIKWENEVKIYIASDRWMISGTFDMLVLSATKEEKFSTVSEKEIRDKAVSLVETSRQTNVLRRLSAWTSGSAAAPDCQREDVILVLLYRDQTSIVMPCLTAPNSVCDSKGRNQLWLRPNKPGLRLRLCDLLCDKQIVYLRTTWDVERNSEVFY